MCKTHGLGIMRESRNIQKLYPEHHIRNIISGTSFIVRGKKNRNKNMRLFSLDITLRIEIPQLNNPVYRIT